MSMHDLRWNFEKILFDKTGQPYARYWCHTEPKDIVPDIQYLLAKPNPTLTKYTEDDFISVLSSLNYNDIDGDIPNKGENIPSVKKKMSRKFKFIKFDHQNKVLHTETAPATIKRIKKKDNGWEEETYHTIKKLH